MAGPLPLAVRHTCPTGCRRPVLNARGCMVEQQLRARAWPVRPHSVALRTASRLPRRRPTARCPPERRLIREISRLSSRAERASRRHRRHGRCAAPRERDRTARQREGGEASPANITNSTLFIPGVEPLSSAD